MLNTSSTLFSNNFPIFFEENHEINPYCSYYDHIQSPMVYYDIENYTDFLSHNSHDSHDLITMIQHPLRATNNSSVLTEDSSILEVNTKENSSISKGEEVMNEVMDEGVIRAGNNNANNCRGSKRRRTSNKDRHSKIRTAHGLRDRRMRLSLEVARPFFMLQDMLGYDKASRTVEWLLTQSKIAIEEILQGKNHNNYNNNGSYASGVTKCTTISSTSDCDEGESSIVVEQKNTVEVDNKHETILKNKGKKRGVGTNCGGKEKRMRTTKEAMKKARDKARKRTLEKMLLSKGVIKDDATIINSSHYSLTLGKLDLDPLSQFQLSTKW